MLTYFYFSDQFRLDLTMAGQDCNTQSAGGVYTNTVVVQRHSVVMTKTDKIYKVGIRESRGLY